MPERDEQPDVLIIGAGSAGFSAAIACAERGAKVLLAGDGTIGGTCVNVGCIPSKNLIRAANAIHEGQRAYRFAGIQGGGTLVDWQALLQQKREQVQELRKAKYEDVLPQYPAIQYREGQASFTGDGLEVALQGKSFRPAKVIVTTGASSVLPRITGIEDIPVLDSTSILDIARLPRSLLILGGGVVGVELAQLFSRLGVAVTICCRSRLLPEAEPEVSAALAQYFEMEGLRVYAGVRYQRIGQGTQGIMLTIESAGRTETIEAEQVLAATGRQPNTADLALERVGVETCSQGGIIVDECMRTTNADIFAAGDVTGRDMFVYMAAYGGKIAAENCLRKPHAAYSNAIMPSVVFTDPQVAHVGLTEAQARQHGYAVKVSLLGLEAVPRFVTARDTRGLIKLIADGKTDRLLGATVLAAESGDSIQTAVMALRAGMTTAELSEVIFPYLTAVEGIKLAAKAFRTDIKKLSCCAG